MRLGVARETSADRPSVGLIVCISFTNPHRPDGPTPECRRPQARNDEIGKIYHKTGGGDLAWGPAVWCGTACRSGPPAGRQQRVTNRAHVACRCSAGMPVLPQPPAQLAGSARQPARLASARTRCGWAHGPVARPGRRFRGVLARVAVSPRAAWRRLPRHPPLQGNILSSPTRRVRAIASPWSRLQRGSCSRGPTARNDEIYYIYNRG